MISFEGLFLAMFIWCKYWI